MTRRDLGGPPAPSDIDGGLRVSPSEIDDQIEDDVESALDLELGSAARIEAGLDEAGARLERTLRMAAAGGAAVSFDTNVPAPERELLGAMRTMGAEAVSFSVEGGAVRPAQAGAKVARFLDRVLERVGAVTRVETRVDGQVVVSTRIGLTGDCASALVEASAPPAWEAHVRSLAEQLRVRRAWTRLVLSTAHMAVKLALATGTGNPLLALPAAFRFIRGVLAELKQIEQAA